MGIAPTTLVISATNLQSTYYSDKNAFAWLRSIAPRAVVGYSLFIYDFVFTSRFAGETAEPEIVTVQKARLQSFERRAAAAVAAKGAMKGALRAGGVAVATLLIAQVLDHFIPLPGSLLKTLWALNAIVVVAVFVSAFRPFAQFSLRERSKQIHLRAPEFPRADDLRLALELAVKEKRSVGAVARRLHRIDGASFREQRAPGGERRVGIGNRPPSPRRCCLNVLAAGSARGAAVGVSVFEPVSFSVPRQRRLAQQHRHRAGRRARGDGRFGESIGARQQRCVRERPELFVKTGSAAGSAASASREEARATGYLIDKITLPVSYRVRWKNEWSERFTLTPVEPLAVLATGPSSLTPPIYTGQPPREQRRAGDPRPGGHARRNKSGIERGDQASLAAVFRRKKDRPAKLDGQTLTFAFELERTGTYQIQLDPVAEMPRVAADSYTVSPSSTIRRRRSRCSRRSRTSSSASNEAVSDPPEAHDDVALGRIELAWQDQNGRTGSSVIKKYSSSLDRDLDTYEWQLSDEGFRPGQRAALFASRPMTAIR